MPLPAVSVCVPVHRAHAAPNLASLAASVPDALDGLDGELVVALNGVSAEEAGAPAAARLVDLGVNRGVAKGWNAAARAARAEVLCFVNDDVVLGPDALRVLHGVLTARPEAGVVGPEGSTWDVETGAHLGDVDARDLPPGAVRECAVVSGFLFALRRATWEALGGFDEAYTPCSWEEVDFCTAVRTRLGLRCFVAGGVESRHEWGISARQPPWRRIRYEGRSELLWSIHRRNRRHFVRKWSRSATPAR